MKKILLIVLVSILFISNYTYSQAPMARQGSTPGNMPADGKVSGKVVDSASGQPVEYASVAIYHAKDSTLVNGVVTDATGTFNMENLPYGKFYATITFIGYKKALVDNILIVPNKKVATLGAVKLNPASTSLNEVVVIGNGNQMEYKIDKKVVNISQNIVASGGTVVDALQNTPSVQTDVEGNLTLRGSSNFTVLIDGKPSVVSGSEALQQIPAGLVQNVEIITNPSAKYEAEGSAGIINVIMKKQKVRGFNGSVSLSAGTNRKNNDNINLNYKYDKWNFSLGADWRDMGFKMRNSSERQTFSEGVLIQDQTINGSGQFSRSGAGLRGGIDYNINNKSSISIGGRWGDRSFSRPMNATYINYLPGLNEYTYYNSVNSGESKDKFYSLNLDYALNFNTSGHQLTAGAYYSGSKENDPSLNKKIFTDNSDVELGTSSQRVDETGDEAEFRFKTDYTLPINEKTKLEAGLQAQFNDNSATHRLFKDEIEDLAEFEKLSFKSNINAGYITFSSSIKPFEYQIGLRAENENRDVILKNTNEQTKINRTDLFPTIHLSKKLPWDLQLQASYTRRISRPRDWDLSPLKRYMDADNIRMGNPGLLPEFTGSYELNLQKKLSETSSVSLEGFYRKTNNPIQQFQYRDSSDTQHIIVINTSKNIGKDESLGGELSLNVGLTKWWTLNGSGSLYYYKLTGETQFRDTTKKSTNWNLRANTMFRFKTGTSLQLNYFYNAPTVTFQGNRGAFYSTGIALRQEILKRKGSLTLQFRDFIGDPKMKMSIQSGDFYSFNQFQRETNVFTVTFTYRINNYKAQRRNSEEMNNDSGGGDMDMM